MSRRFWFCPECGSLNFDFHIFACMGCNTEFEECDIIFEPDEDECIEYPMEDDYL